MPYLIAYVAAGLTFGALDAVWLTTMSNRLYKPLLGEILAPAVNLPAAAIFYLIYVFGIVALAVEPGLRTGSMTRTVVTAAILGGVAYATYDLTNQATLKVWSTRITVMDIGWGVFVTTAAAMAGLLAARWAARQFG
jgi:uncharacterized membrane protein